MKLKNDQLEDLESRVEKLRNKDGKRFKSSETRNEEADFLDSSRNGVSREIERLEQCRNVIMGTGQSEKRTQIS